MTFSFPEFTAASQHVAPKACVVLGSGLGDVASEFRIASAVAYADVPGLVPPSVHGHKGQMAVGHWGKTPAIICFGRVHFYEGHPWERVTRLVNLVADLGVKVLVLTNAAGGIPAELNPGDLMAIRGHLKLLDGAAWSSWAERAALPDVYSLRLLKKLAELDPELPVGIYAALTGPTYETPAEIRALTVAGADTVGMSTAMEAEAGVARGLEVAAISCVTNKAAGLGDGTLSHHEVDLTAKTAVGRLRTLLGGLLANC